MKNPTLEERIDELESRLSFQDATIATLDSVIRSQQKEIDTLNARLEKLITLRSAQDEGVEAMHEKPPHY